MQPTHSRQLARKLAALAVLACALSLGLTGCGGGGGGGGGDGGGGQGQQATPPGGDSGAGDPGASPDPVATSFMLSLSAVGRGSISGACAPTSDSACASSYPAGAIITLTAAPETGYTFAGWGGDCAAAGVTPTATVTMTADQSCSASFVRNAPSAYTLTVSAASGGKVSDGASINCTAAAGACAASYGKGATVLLSATPDAGYSFSGWGGDCVDAATSLTVSVVMGANRSCSAAFVKTAASKFTLGISVTGSGSVSHGDAACTTTAGSACLPSYEAGSVASLIATPNAGYSFSGWGGNCASAGTTPTARVTMDANKSCSATFTKDAPSTYTLKVSVASGGKVTDATSAIACTSAAGSACSAGYATGVAVTLTQQPDPGYSFAGWGGDCAGAGTSATASVPMNANKSCSAAFKKDTPSTYTLTVSATSGGKVTDATSAIACTSAESSGCSAEYASGVAVTLTATADAGYLFSTWSGNCSGTSPAYTVTMSANQSCRATFSANAPSAYTLTVSITGNGSVSDQSAGKLSCASTGSASCSASYSPGATVTLAATAASGYAFSGWGGACAGAQTGSTASVAMNAAQNCSASFAANSSALTGPPRPTVSGNQLIDARTGKTWAPHGANVPSLEYACVQGWTPNANFTLAGAQAMASWGMDVVRFPLNEDCWLGTDGAPVSGSGTAAQYQARIAQWVGWAHQSGLAVIFDLHWSAPPGYYGIDQLSMTDSQSKTFWQQVAAAYRSDPSVMFELFNEPYQWLDKEMNWDCWANGGCALRVANQSGAWAPASAPGDATFTAVGMKDLVAAVRGAGATQPVIVNGLNYANDLTGWLANAPGDSQIIAGWHNYKGQGCAQTCWNSTITAVAAKVPVLITEFGYETTDPAYFGQVMDWADARSIGYLPWAWWWNAGTGPYQLLADAAFTPTAGEGAAFKSHLAGLAARAARAAPRPK